MSRKMLNNVIEELENYGAGYSNWAILMIWFTQPFYEVAIVGKSVDELYTEMAKHYLPNVIFAGSAVESLLPLLKHRYQKDKTSIFVCTDRNCLFPVTDVFSALKLMA